jgi:hypothetical protein
MPKVGDKHYPYTAKGKAAAKAAAKRKGVKVTHGKGYMGGGAVHRARNYMGGGGVHKCAVHLGNGAPRQKR